MAAGVNLIVLWREDLSAAESMDCESEQRQHLFRDPESAFS
jgi:hypothetical protein